jgi:hypothetical protein
VMHSSLRNAIGNHARSPEPNDFVDAVHAMYAPYVDLFRGPTSTCRRSFQRMRRSTGQT